MVEYAALALIAVVAAAACTVVVRALAQRVGILDVPNWRRIHTGHVPRFGGVAVYLAFVLTAGIAFDWKLVFGASYAFDLSLFSEIMVGGTIILLLGVYDDIRGAGIGLKLGGQLLAAGVMVLFGYDIPAISLPWGGEVELGILSVPFTLLWIIGIVNGLNLIDGVDGLATGVAFISAASSFFLAILFGNPEIAPFYAILAGATLGFLRYNFNPASIFLGDSGSMYLGFLLATLSIKSSQKSPTAIAIFIPILILGLPILDAGLSFGRRYLKASGLVDGAGRVSLRNLRLLHLGPAFRPDKEHIHHRLLGTGISPREVTILLYLVCVGLAVMAFSVAMTSQRGVVVLGIYAAVVLFAGMNRLGYFRGLTRYRGSLADSLRAPWERKGARILLLHAGESSKFAPLKERAERLGHQVTLVDSARLGDLSGQPFQVVISELVPEPTWLQTFGDRVKNVFQHSVHVVADTGSGGLATDLSFHDGIYDLIDLQGQTPAADLAIQRAIEKAQLVSRLKFFYGLLWMLGIISPILFSAVVNLARAAMNE